MTESRDFGGDSDLHKLAFFSLLAGTTSLIPIPFVDDWAYRFVRREMVEAVFSSGPVPITQEQLKELTEARAQAARFGCAGRAAYMLIWLPIRFAVYFALRLFKKILIFLVIKEVTDRVSLVFHEGYLFEYATTRSHLLPARPDWPAQLRESVKATVAATDTSPVQAAVKRVFRESGALMSTVTRSTVSLFRKLRPSLADDRIDRRQADDFLEQEEKLLSEPTSLFLRLVTGEADYLARLEQRFLHHISTTES